jgi:hypothetical protein
MRFISSNMNLSNVDIKSADNLTYNKLGSLIDNDDDQKIFAQSLCISIDNNTKQNKYLVLTYKNQLYDPYGTDSHREKSLELKLKNVNKDTFSYYLRYLQTKNSLYMTRANRSFIDE